MQRRQKNQLKYTDCAELKKITNRIYSNCLIYSSLFSNPLNFIAAHFVKIYKPRTLNRIFVPGSTNRGSENLILKIKKTMLFFQFTLMTKRTLKM